MPGILVDGVVAVRFVTPMSVVSNQPVFASDAISLKRFTRSQLAQRWEIKTSIEPSNHGYAWFVHSVINGYDNVFDVRMPQVYIGEGVYSTGNFTGSGTAGATSLSVSGAGTLKAGEFINFSNHNKVYMVTADCSGGTLNILPRLQKDVTGTVYSGNNVTFKAKYDSSTVLGMTYMNGILADPGAITLIEDM